MENSAMFLDSLVAQRRAMEQVLPERLRTTRGANDDADALAVKTMHNPDYLFIETVNACARMALPMADIYAAFPTLTASKGYQIITVRQENTLDIGRRPLASARGVAENVTTEKQDGVFGMIVCVNDAHHLALFAAGPATRPRVKTWLRSEDFRSMQGAIAFYIAADQTLHPQCCWRFHRDTATMVTRAEYRGLVRALTDANVGARVPWHTFQSAHPRPSAIAAEMDMRADPPRAAVVAMETL